MGAQKSAPHTEKKTLNLALQGGGSHGAFTWGVLDEFLSDGRVQFEGITATSAGSMNAVIMLQGLMREGPEHARALLEEFWRRVSQANAVFGFPGLQPDASLAFNWFESLTQFASPYQLNPFNLNPLRDILNDMVDFKAMAACKEGKLFICATHVESGNADIFENHELSVDVLLASAALPQLFQAVEIGGRHYWDGGYMGNPALWPLFYDTQSRDILIVHVNPIVREAVPKDAVSIENRLNEISFNSAMLKDIRAIAFVKKLIESDMLKDEFKDHYKDILLHAIRTEKVMADLPHSSKFNTSWDFLTNLRDLGRAEAKTWLRYNFKNVGVKSSVDIQRDYLSTRRFKPTD